LSGAKPADIAGRSEDDDGMARSLDSLLAGVLPDLRHLRTIRRVRVRLGDDLVADTMRAELIWEPMRVVPSYAVPEGDIRAQLVPAEVGPPPTYRAVGFGEDSPPLLDPSVPFTVHTAAGRPMTVVLAGAHVESAAYALDDPDLAGYVVLDFDAFDWFEEDQPLLGHPRDPLHRIDVCSSSRTVRIEHEGTILAETDRARLLFEGTFPMARYYLPRDAVRVPLVPGSAETTCAYKGRATHWTVEADGLRLPDIAWSYEDPEPDAVPVAGHLSFYTERLDVYVDGELVRRVRTPWSDGHPDDEGDTRPSEAAGSSL
jgi:uncharacterized protein (DUF427 family)